MINKTQTKKLSRKKRISRKSKTNEKSYFSHEKTTRRYG